MMNVLITGGSGLIGRRLTGFLQERGYRVSWLVRSNASQPVPAYRWSPEKSFIDESALQGQDVLIHLAGENVGKGRWTAKRKKQILESRTKGTELLTTTLARLKHPIKTVICASAIGFYGDGDAHEFTEASVRGNGFLAEVTGKWEAAAQLFQRDGVRLVTLRIGVVLSKDGGAVPQLALPIRFFIGAPIGSGRQMLSWIHIEDLCRMFEKAISDESMHGVYNAVASYPVDNATITRLMARHLHRPLLLPAVPVFAIRLLLGEMAAMVTGGARVSSEKIRQAGFNFLFEDADKALKDVLA